MTNPSTNPDTRLSDERVAEMLATGLEQHSAEEKARLKSDAGIPHMPTDLTYEARMAISGEGPQAYSWSDKKHRLVYDLCRVIEEVHAELQALRAPAETEPAAWTNGAGSYLAADAFALQDDLVRSRYNTPLFTHPLRNPSPSDREVSEEMVEAALSMKEALGVKIPKDYLIQILQSALQSSRRGQP